MPSYTCFRPVIPLKVKDQIVDELSQGINRKVIADKYKVSQTFITDVKQAMPLFCYCFNKEMIE